MLTSTERMTVTDGARGEDNRKSSALSTENYFALFVFGFWYLFEFILYFLFLSVIKRTRHGNTENLNNFDVVAFVCI